VAVDAFTPLKIGPVELPNRLAMAPVKTAFGGPDGLVCPEHVSYYRRRAAGGVGLIIVEPLVVDPKGREHPRQLGAYSDEYGHVGGDKWRFARELLVADPDLPRKMREGRKEDIMSCGACLQGCLAKVKDGGPIGCIVNPELGHEDDQPPSAASAGERLLVVGGGPAGMEAALAAHRAGFRVTMLERRASLGGQFMLAPLTTGKEAMKRPLQSLIDAVTRSGVEIRTGFEATVDTILDLEPDHVIVATGSQPITPPIPGLDDPPTAEQVLTGARETGARVLILGGGLVGIEMAEHLSLAGREVVVVELLGSVARDMEAITRKMTLKRLEALPVTILTTTRLVRLEDHEAVVCNADNGEERSLGSFDSVLVAVGHRSYDPLSDGLLTKGVSVTVVGDAREPRQIFDATQAGRDAVASIIWQTNGTSTDETGGGTEEHKEKP
jgi:NADPH-dependent 2,4-dienoyl-CoA reductase/sulfur reductase-like enzyme